MKSEISHFNKLVYNDMIDKKWLLISEHILMII